MPRLVFGCWQFRTEEFAFDPPTCGRMAMKVCCPTRGCLKKMELALWDEGVVRFECPDCLMCFSYREGVGGWWWGEWSNDVS